MYTIYFSVEYMILKITENSGCNSDKQCLGSCYFLPLPPKKKKNLEKAKSQNLFLYSSEN